MKRSHYNPKLLKAMKEGRAEAWLILTALRGPDSGRLDEKRRFTAPIRGWVFRVGATESKWVHGCLTTTMLNMKKTRQLLVEARELEGHFGGHIREALRAILVLEGK